MKRIIYIVLIATASVTYFMRSDYKGVNDIAPQVLMEPIQTPLLDQKPIEFQRNGFDFKATPLYAYEISGLILSRQDYNKWYALTRTDSVYPTDLCMGWGNTIRKKTYQHSSLSVTQDGRWCYFRWSGRLDFDSTSISNSHLLFKDNKLEAKLNNVFAGDQVRIKGKLVNVSATNIGTKKPYEFNKANWKTSTVRTDSGDGACEVILVEDIEILTKANIIPQTLHKLSTYSLALMVLLGIINLFRPLKARKKPSRQPA